MTNQNSHTNRQLDDQLAEFTDQLLDKKIPLDLWETDSQDQTLLELQKTVARLAQAFADEPIDESVAQRIKSSLTSEWKKVGNEDTKASLWSQWQQNITKKLSHWRPARNRKAVYAFAFVSLTAIVIVAVFFPNLVRDQNLTGTALGESFPFLALLIFAVVIGLVYLFIRNRR